MPYQTSDGTYVNTKPLGAAAVASAARTADGHGSSQETGIFTTLRSLKLTVTAKSGTSPTLDVKVQSCATDSATDSDWWTVGAFTQVGDATGTETKSFPGLGRFFRIAWDLGGTSPSYTFSVGGTDAELI